ncbi:hypothetical protein J3459_018264 [Metarhizium acridum]|uniref:uncharacterized protein n=1 Tax=Metarhizium acridum TaxID=92637 RepID=UPI001C6B741F|nr:hypothetical protein J3459_018610 [Metarhizium acridum]KAG8408028.1 hypothetical protein J3459_018264 [Metarhizium acridum]KAG8410213.1 hypothetical protein J3458_018249 [Metarhizium acridum]
MNSGDNEFYIGFGHLLDGVVNVPGDFSELQATLESHYETVPTNCRFVALENFIRIIYLSRGLPNTAHRCLSQSANQQRPLMEVPLADVVAPFGANVASLYHAIAKGDATKYATFESAARTHPSGTHQASSRTSIRKGILVQPLAVCALLVSSSWSRR